MIANISSLLNEVFLIEEQSAKAYLPMVASMLTGNYKSVIIDFSAERARLAPFAISANTKARRGDTAAHNNESYIGVIQLSGVVLKDDQECGPRGTKTLTKQVNYYKNDAECIGLIGVIDTPGGQVSYTDLFADAIRGFGKPTAAFVEGTAASAGYWVASSFDEIYTSSTLDDVGSIGAYASFADFSGFFEKQGIVLHEIYAPQSTDKNGDYKEAKAGNYKPYAEGVLKPVVDKFIADVSINRTAIDKSVFTGKMYGANEAIILGMIDGVKSFDEVVDSVLERSNNLNNNKNKGMSATEKKFPNLAKTAGFDNDELILTDAEASLNEASLDAIEARLGDIDALELANTDLTSSNEDLTAANTDLQSRFDALTVSFEALKAKPGAGAASGEKEGDAFGGGALDITATFAHNKVADRFGK